MRKNTNPDRCVKCGKCCRSKRERGDGKVVALKDYACPFLDRATNRCLVYPYRFQARRSCLSLPEAIALGELPPDCPNVRGVYDYKSVVDVWEE